MGFQNFVVSNILFASSIFNLTKNDPNAIHTSGAASIYPVGLLTIKSGLLLVILLYVSEIFTTRM